MNKHEYPKQVMYLSGPMRGLEDFNYPKFNSLAKLYRDAGFTVHNPAESFNGATDKQFKEYMRLDFEMVLDSDVIFMLIGWNNSEGARLEWQMAKALGLEIRYEAGADVGESVELEAARIVRNGAREKSYGHPGSDFARTGQYWGVAKQEVALRMIQLKISRLIATPAHRDSVVDLIGYAICYARIMLEGGYAE